MTWTEPSRAVPLRWGRYDDRYLWGLILIVAGAVSIQGGNANFNLPLGLGTLAHTMGWWLMPAAGWRRIWAVLPSLLAVWILLMGPAAAGLLALPFASWLLVRHRPWFTVLFALPVFGVGLALHSVYVEMSGIMPTLAITGATMVACAWAARFAAQFRQSHRQSKGVPA
jgi:hypothetical protein